VSINKKMAILSLVTIVTIGLVAIFSGITLAKIRSEFLHYQSQVAIAKDLVEIKATALSVAKGDPILPETADALSMANERIRALMQEIDNLDTDASVKQAMQEVDTNWTEYLRQFNSAIKIAADSPMDALNIPDAIYKLQLLPMVSSLDTLVESSRIQENSSTTAIRYAMSRILWMVLVPMIAGGLFVVVSQMLFSRNLKRRVSSVQRVVAKLEDGDLTQRLPDEGKDEIAEIAHAVNGFVIKAHGILSQLHASADEVASAAARLFSASEGIAGSSRGQSNAASSVASTVEEMSVSIAQVADLAHSAHTLSRESGEVLSQGSTVVLSAADEMSRISQSVRESAELIMDLEQRSADITAIIKVIRDVADQTNLLALNAAIEAARAGEQGRGFAVVADEVRSLAERTSESTQEIANVITKIQEATRVVASSMEAGVQHVEKGVALASEAGDSITRVRTSAGRVVDVVDNISLALREQTAASEDISRQVENIAAISQENSEAAQHTVSTARELELLASNLEQAVKQFRL